MKRVRLDTELVRRGLASSRSEAREAIMSGSVDVQGVPTPSPATMVNAGTGLVLREPASRFVSRGGMKLDGALAELEIEVSGKRWLDAGASTGGFTDRLLQGGATEVAAVDVGYGQLDWGLRNDERVHVLERANVRFMGPQDLPWAPEGVVADLSFISLRLVLPVLQRISTPEADHLLLVKPQFELGRGRVSKGGVVTDPAEWREAVGAVIGSAAEIGLGLVGCAPSMFPGPAGNREFFVHLRAGADGSLSSVDRAIERAP